jgi:hypothetical protein
LSLLSSSSSFVFLQFGKKNEKIKSVYWDIFLLWKYEWISKKLDVYCDYDLFDYFLFINCTSNCIACVFISLTNKSLNSQPWVFFSLQDKKKRIFCFFSLIHKSRQIRIHFQDCTYWHLLLKLLFDICAIICIIKNSFLSFITFTCQFIFFVRTKCGSMYIKYYDCLFTLNAGSIYCKYIIFKINIVSDYSSRSFIQNFNKIFHHGHRYLSNYEFSNSYE